MASPRTSAREEERRFNLRTLTIASAASATAAVVTSQLWIAGTWIAAAMTPVLVALVSELLHKPTERIAERLSSDRPAPRPGRIDPDPDAAPIRIYRSTSTAPRRRKVAVGAVLGTAGLALLIAVVVLTVTELAAGGAIGRSNAKTTFLSPDRNRPASDDEKQPVPSEATEETTTTTETTTEPPADSVPTTEPPPTTPPPAGEPGSTEPAPAPSPAEQP